MALADVLPHIINPNAPVDPVMLGVQTGIERGRRFQLDILANIGVATEVAGEEHDYGQRDTWKKTNPGFTDEEIDKLMQEEANRG